MELPHRLSINGGRSSLVAAFCLRLADALHLPLLADGGLELCEDAQHLQKAPAGCRAGVDRLLGGAKGDASLFKLAHDGREIRNRAGEAVNAGDDDLVTGPSEVDQRPELRAALNGGAGPLFLTDDFTPGCAQGVDLSSKVLAPMN
jgi:hypothetical protein